MKPLFILFISCFLATGAMAQAKYHGMAAKALPPAYTKSLFRNTDGTYFNLGENGANGTLYGHLNILDWLQGRVAGLQVMTVRSGNRVAFIRNSPATIYLDDMRIDPSFLSMLPVQDISLVKVMRGPSSVIWGGQGGAIALYTKRGDSEEEQED
jgi:outer membrane receptor protein involved in Fe transport